jgi:hypothetical protein
MLLAICRKEIENSWRSKLQSLYCKLSKAVLQAGEKKKLLLFGGVKASNKRVKRNIH